MHHIHKLHTLLYTVQLIQFVKLHNPVTFQMLHNVVTFENVTSYYNIVLLHMYVTFWGK